MHETASQATNLYQGGSCNHKTYNDDSNAQKYYEYLMRYLCSIRRGKNCREQIPFFFSLLFASERSDKRVERRMPVKHQGSKGSAAGNRSAGSGAKKSVKPGSSGASCQVDALAQQNEDHE